MVRDIKGEVDKLKKLLLQDAPIWIEGINFDAFNYGHESNDYTPAGSDSRVSGETGSAIIDRRTGKWRFTESHIRIPEVSHVPKFERVKVDLTFDEVKKELEKR